MRTSQVNTREGTGPQRGAPRDYLLLSIFGSAALLTIVEAAALLFGKPGALTVEIPWFVPLMNIFLLVSALCVAFLALSRFYVLRCPVSYWLGVASVTLAGGLVFYVLTWPGLIPGGRFILGHSPRTSGWMAIIAQSLLSVFMLAAGLAQSPARPRKDEVWLRSAAFWVLAGLSLHISFLAFSDRLPPLIRPGGKFTPLVMALQWIAFALFAAGAFISTGRYRSSGNKLLAYIALGQLAWGSAILLLILGARRYGASWYLDRILTAGSFLPLMFGLLSEYTGLFRREQEKSRVLKDTLEGLREVRDRLVLAQQAGRLGIFDWDIQRDRLIWTEELEKLFGLAPGAFEGNYESWAKRLYPADRSHVESLFRRWISERRREADFEHRIVRADSGAVRWVAVRARISYSDDGSPTRMIGTKVDITERKMADEAIRRGESMMSQAAGMASLGAWGIEFKSDDDVDRNPLHWSDEVFRIFGYAPGSVEVTNEFFWKHVHPDDRRPVREAVEKAIREKQPYAIEHRIVRPDGTERIVVEHADIRFDEQWRPIEMIGAVQDITERKQTEEALHRAKNELEMRVLERTAELERRNQDLQDFAFIASHDLKEPLRKIRSFGDLLLARSRDSLGEESLGFLARMKSAASRMQVLLDSLLDYSRVTTKGSSFKSVDLNQAVQEALSNLEMRIRETDASVEVQFLPSDIEADEVQLVQLFQNLLGNALKFHKQDTTPRIHVFSRVLENLDSGVQVYVKDNGIGFEEKYLEKIFAPFQRLHGRDGYEGVGMGLAICKKIVDRHRGTITAKSTPGGGSTFIVTLPAKQEER